MVSLLWRQLSSEAKNHKHFASFYDQQDPCPIHVYRSIKLTAMDHEMSTISPAELSLLVSYNEPEIDLSKRQTASR